MPRPITLELATASTPLPTAPADRLALVGVVDDLLTLLEAQFPDADDFPAAALRSRLQQSRDRLHASQAEAIADAGLKLVADVSHVHARMAAHATTRESEFLGVIRLLRELVDGLRGDARVFRHDLIRTSERVADLTHIEDLRSLRRELNREVAQLRQCVQHGERREASRLADLAGDLRKVDAMTEAAIGGREKTGHPPGRAVLLADLAACGKASAAVVVCRIDEPEAIVHSHGSPVLERVTLALADLLKESFGKDTKVYRTSTQCVAIFLPRVTSKQAARQVRQVQSRVAPEYEYERLGVRRRVVFTFSAAVVQSSGRSARDGSDALGRAERQALTWTGPGQLHAEASGLGRLVEWLAAGH